MTHGGGSSVETDRMGRTVKITETVIQAMIIEVVERRMDGREDLIRMMQGQRWEGLDRCAER